VRCFIEMKSDAAPETKALPSGKEVYYCGFDSVVLEGRVMVANGDDHFMKIERDPDAFTALFFTSLMLFLIGIAFCYFAVYLLAVDFFIVAGENLATPMLSIDKYVGFMFGFIVPFGVAFMLPVFLYVTTKLGWTNYEMLASKRKFVIFGIFIFAAILTPPDVISQLLLGIPMVALYEVGAQITRKVKPAHRDEDEAEAE